MIFIERPISAGLLALAVVAVVIAVIPAVSRKRDVVFQEEDERVLQLGDEQAEEATMIGFASPARSGSCSAQ